MKINYLTVLFCLASYFTNGQSIGIRVNKEYSNIKESNNALGAGLYIDINDSSKIEYILSGDYFWKRNKFHDCIECLTHDISTRYNSLSIGLTGLWTTAIKSHAKFRIGPSISYKTVVANRQGQIASWTETLKARYVGTGITANLQLQRVFNMPVNFDIFISPVYLINIKNETASYITSEYTHNIIMLNFQIGISYIIIQ